MIGPEGGTASSIDGARLVEFPAGAVEFPLEITITPVPAGAGAVGTVFDIGPDGTLFDRPVSLSLQLPSDLDGAAPERLALGRIVDDPWGLLERGAIEPMSGVASGVTTHLSRYGITLWVDICGDGRCWGEQCNCPGDCGVIPTGCGDGLCCGLEDCESCPSDCDACCGNGFLNDGEACDGRALPQTYRSLGFDDGDLACTESCQFDTSDCRGCGNGVKEDPEECDGADLGGATCESLGRPPGVLRCSSDCLLEDFCNCGDGQLDEGENCDGVELGGRAVLLEASPAAPSHVIWSAASMRVVASSAVATEIVAADSSASLATASTWRPAPSSAART